MYIRELSLARAVDVSSRYNEQEIRSFPPCERVRGGFRIKMLLLGSSVNRDVPLTGYYLVIPSN